MFDQPQKDALISYLQFNDGIPDGVQVDGNTKEQNERRNYYFLLLTEWTQAGIKECDNEHSVMKLIDECAAGSALEQPRNLANSQGKMLDELFPLEERRQLTQILKDTIHLKFFYRENILRGIRSSCNSTTIPSMP